MLITVEYEAQLKRAAGIGVERIEIDPPVSVETLIAAVAAAHGEPLKSLVLSPDGAVHPSILIFVGDEQVRPDAPIELRDRDVVTLLSPISGG